jgi:hypothetical protein
MEARFARVKTGLAEIFLGDWHPVLRDPLDLFRLSFVVGAVIFALQSADRRGNAGGTALPTRRRQR